VNKQENEKRTAPVRGNAQSEKIYVVSLIAIALFILMSVLLPMIPERVDVIDVTDSKLYTLSDQTLSILDSLSEDITLYFVAKSDDENMTIRELLDRYGSASSRMKVIKVDPEKKPNFVSQYTEEDLTDNFVIVEGSKRFSIVKYEEIFLYDYADYMTTGAYSLSFDGEHRITAAIDFVVSDSLPVIYALSGHGEKQMSAELAKLVATDNLDARSLNLISAGAVPGDARCVMILDPITDVTDQEAESILQYLEAGGRMLLVTSGSSSDFPNLESLLQSYGVVREKGKVLEGNSDYYVSGDSSLLLPLIRDHDVTKPTIEHNQRILMPNAQAITRCDSARFDLQTTELLVTSESARVDGTDLKGTLALGVSVEEKNRDIITDIIWYTSGDMLDDDVNGLVSNGNFNLFLNSLSWLCGKEDNLSIRSVGYNTEKLSLSTGEVYRCSILLVLVIPAAVLAVGGVVYFKRKRKY
jgi:ABC-2 type transport system permease protein